MVRFNADLLSVSSRFRDDNDMKLQKFRALPLLKKVFPMRIGRTEFPEIKLITIWFGKSLCLDLVFGASN